MDRFSDVSGRSVHFMITALNEASHAVIGDGGDGSTSLVKNLQALQWGKVVTAVGIFSIFEARLQDGLNCSDGFAELRKLLLSADERDLALRFDCFAAAVNVLKHGKGRSYDWLLSRREALPFKIKVRDQNFFFEGDVSEPDTLVLVDDAFVQSCGDLIQSLIGAIQTIRPDVYFG